MGGTILGPGTIFLMLVGAFVAAFQIDNWTSFYYNVMPILFFMLVCFTCKSNIQVRKLKINWIIFCIYIIFFYAVNCSTNLIYGLCVDYDGSHRWYSSSVEGGRYRFAVRHFLDSDDRLVFHSGVFTSSRILVYCTRNNIFVIHTFYVLTVDFVLNY